jgi:O-antigen ligase
VFASNRATAGGGESRTRSWRIAIAGYVLLAVAILIFSRFVIGRLGADQFATVLVGILFAILLSIISFRYLPIPFYIWILSVCGFRFLWSIQTPILPDLYLDRMAMIWLAMVFLVKAVAERRAMVRPIRIDLLLLANALYLLTQIIMHDMEFFGTWVVSILIPYSAFFLTKNIIITQRQIRTLLWILLALSVYYNVTSVAEKYGFNFLIWPKYIIGMEGEFRGRSQGPFMQAPLFGTVIGVLLPIHLYFLATVRRNGVRVLLIASLLVGLAGLYFTYTRGSWLAGLAALGTTAALNRKVYLRYLLPAVIIGGILAVGVLGLGQDKFMKERVENENTIGSRLATAVTVFRVWRDNPLFGCGFFQYRNVREKYIEPVEIPGLPTIRFVQFRHNAIHDIYLGPLAETGLVGTAMQLAIYVLILRAFVRKYYRRHVEDHYVSFVMPVLAGILVGYLVGGLAFDYRFFAVIGTLFLVSAGIIDGYRIESSPAAAVKT